MGELCNVVGPLLAPVPAVRRGGHGYDGQHRGPIVNISARERVIGPATHHLTRVASRTSDQQTIRTHRHNQING